MPRSIFIGILTAVIVFIGLAGQKVYGFEAGDKVTMKAYCFG